MAKLRKFVAYRRIVRAYTRYSKYRSKGFIKSRPGKKVIKFDMGDLKGVSREKLTTRVELLCMNEYQVRTNAIESARVQCVRVLEKTLKREDFYFRIKMIPHHVIREHVLATGAGADRSSSGMSHAFGKPIGTGAQMKIGKTCMEVYVAPERMAVAKKALEKASHKLPFKTKIRITSVAK